MRISQVQQTSYQAKTQKLCSQAPAHNINLMSCTIYAEGAEDMSTSPRQLAREVSRSQSWCRHWEQHRNKLPVSEAVHRSAKAKCGLILRHFSHDSSADAVVYTLY